MWLVQQVYKVHMPSANEQVKHLGSAANDELLIMITFIL